jgi:hypothetical protein
MQFGLLFAVSRRSRAFFPPVQDVIVEPLVLRRTALMMKKMMTAFPNRAGITCSIFCGIFPEPTRDASSRCSMMSAVC